MPEAILTILKFCFLALLYLFLIRVVRVVYLELGGRTRSRRRAPTRGAGASGASRGRNRKSSGRRPLHLEVVEPATSAGSSFEIPDELTLGRAATCAVTLSEDTYVSQLHARFFLRDGELYVEDLGSTNGTYLNRKKLTCEMPVHQGDRIQVGRTVLELSK